MNKKLMAVAVAGALSAPALALAQASTLQIYGKAVFEYGLVDQGNGKPNMDTLQGPGGQAIGFKGEEALGGGLSVWYQCESSADIRGDGGAASTAAAAGPSNGDGFCSRNSALGMKGGFGSVGVGKWDTPFKNVMLRGEVGAEDTGLFGVSQYTSGGSTGAVAGANRTLWQRRQHDNIRYNSPNFSGFQVSASFSAANSNAVNPATGVSNASTNAKPRVWSIGGLYDNGPLSLGLAYERHSQFAGVGGSNDDHAWSLSGSYTFAGKVKVGGSYIKQDYDMGAGTSADKKAWLVGVDWALSGPHSLWANYVSAGDTNSNVVATTPGAGGMPASNAAGGTGVKKWGIGYQHKFSKRTDGKLGYVRLDNDTNANYNLMGVSNTGTTAAARLGNSQSAWVMLMRHSF